MSNSHIRQQDIVTPEELSVPITLIGAGGIGSWVALALTKMGCSQLTVVDHDAVEEHNVASQFYSTEDLSQEKVYCLSENLEKFTGQVVRPVFQRFEDYINSEEYSVPEILLVTVDSLNARRSIWAELRKQEEQPAFYIDARMGGEILRYISFYLNNEDNVTNYEQRLFDTTRKPHEEPCTARAIAYNTFVCGGFVANTVKRYVKGEDIRGDVVVDINNLAID